MTAAQKAALKWLAEHGGDAIFDLHGVALAMGESAPVQRITWNRLADLGRVEFYNPYGRGRGRVRLVVPA